VGAPTNFDVIPRVRSVEPTKHIRREAAAATAPAGNVAQPVGASQSLTTQGATRSAVAPSPAGRVDWNLVSMHSSSSW
jgi:hypothetical protein